MRALRVIGSAFLVLLGSMLMVVWALSVKTVHSIEDGTAADQLATRVLEAPETANLIADQVQAALVEQVEGRVGNLALVLLDAQIHGLIVDVVGSDFVTEAALSGANRVQNRLLDEVSDPDREMAPFTLSIDVGQRINSRLDEIPVVGALVPELDIPVFSADVIDAQTFEDVRTGFSALKFAATWFVWLGLVSIAGGIALAPRWRRFLPRALIGAGTLGVAISFALGSIGPRTLASFMPGGRDGGAGILVEDVVATTALQPIVDVLMRLGLVALVLAGVFWLALRFLPGQADSERTRPSQGAADQTADPVEGAVA
ncbi:hypothetical protein [Demequina sp.]|uniref:hypothetical protein n=1 Tax=Demequina sp. TaxID=2050685 RepID=UPI003A855B10